jgi:hypothetical protein
VHVTFGKSQDAIQIKLGCRLQLESAEELGFCWNIKLFEIPEVIDYFTLFLQLFDCRFNLCSDTFVLNFAQDCILNFSFLCINGC